jgi:hypothetical protein
VLERRLEPGIERDGVVREGHDPPERLIDCEHPRVVARLHVVEQRARRFPRREARFLGQPVEHQRHDGLAAGRGRL